MPGTVTIPLTVALTRTTDTSTTPPMTAADLQEVDVQMSVDNGNTYTKVGTLAPTAAQFQASGLSPGNYQVYATETDKQANPMTSKPSNVVQFTIPAPELAAPNPPVLGAPVIS